MKEINLEEIINKFDIISPNEVNGIYERNQIKEAMKEACEQVLELASENIKSEALASCGSDCPDCWDINSIINTINQVK